MSLAFENLPTDEQFQEILKEKLQDVEKEVRDAKQLINLHKDWYKGSPQQQRSRKRSYKKNLEKLPILESKVNLIKKMLKEEKC